MKDGVSPQETSHTPRSLTGFVEESNVHCPRTQNTTGIHQGRFLFLSAVSLEMKVGWHSGLSTHTLSLGRVQ